MKQYLAFIFPAALIFPLMISAEEYCEEITPTTRPCFCSSGPNVRGEYLYLQATTDPIIFSARVEDVDLENFIVGKTIAQTIDFAWDSAFRVGVGYQFLCDHWDANISWMRLRTRSVNTLRSDQPQFLFIPDQFFIPTEDNFLVSTYNRGTWRYDFDSLDFDLGRWFYIGPCLSMRPEIGLKTVWMKQKLRETAEDVSIKFDFLDELVFFANTTQATLQGRYWAIGPKIGLSGKWEWFCDLGLFGKVAGGLIWGAFNDSKLIFYGDVDVSALLPFPPFTFTAPAVAPNEDRVRPFAEMQVGLDWVRYFCDNQFFFNLSVGYEVQHYWKQQLILNESYLNIKGLFVSAKLGF